MKKWWKSSTLWFHTVMTTLSTAAASFTFLQPVLPVKTYAIAQFFLALVQTAGGMLLRFATTENIVDQRKADVLLPAGITDRRAHADTPVPTPPTPPVTPTQGMG